MFRTLWCLLLLYNSVTAAGSRRHFERRVRQVHQPYALQTGPDASSFASAILFDEGSLFVTGTTYGHAFDADGDSANAVGGASRCFLGVMPLQEWQWNHVQTLGHDNIVSADEPNDSILAASQVCSHLTVHHNRVIVTGHSGKHPGGVLDPLYNRGAVEENERYGTFLDLSSDDDYLLLGGAVSQQSMAVYPVGIDSRPDETHVYVASMFSDDFPKHDSSQEKHAMRADPNWVLPVGEHFGLLVEGYRLQQTNSAAASDGSVERSLLRSFSKHYLPSKGESVTVAGLVVAGDVLVVAGHTWGQGQVFGTAFEDSESMDGFVTKFRKDNGHVVDSEASTYRIESMNGGEEELRGICHLDDQDVYVVGGTTGNLDRDKNSHNSIAEKKAFITKISLDTMLPVWTKELDIDSNDADPDARLMGISCTVTPDGDEVWFAGHVESNGRVEHSHDTVGGATDVFVAKLSAESGDVIFVRQFGSSLDDELASRGGLATDGEGNAILVGNTYGALYREKQSSEELSSNVFVTTVSRLNGDMILPVGHPDHVPPTRPHKHGHKPPSNNVQAPRQPASNESSGNGRYVFLVLLLVGGILAVVLFASYYARHSMKRDVQTDRAKVLKYLNSFDVEDIDLKHSATGGWHCSYTNNLAQGHYHESSTHGTGLFDSPRKTPIDPLTAPLSMSLNSSIVRESLFMDEDDKEYGDLYGGQGEGEGYGGLVDTYNRTWEDRSKQKRRSDKKKKRSSSKRTSSNEDGTWGRGIV